MSKKLRGIGVQLVGFFVLAILIPTLILAFRAIETTKSAQTENLKLTSVQTLQETKMGFTNYLKNISQPVDLLTRNDAVKHLEDRGDYDTNVTTVQDALIASVKVTNGAERAYFSTVTGHLITGWTEWDNTKNKLIQQKTGISLQSVHLQETAYMHSLQILIQIHRAILSLPFHRKSSIQITATMVQLPWILILKK